MKRSEPIKVFEHQRLSWKEAGLSAAQVDRLIAWNESSGNRFFTVGHKSFTFTEHVGVVQVGRTVIEVLPKADRSEEGGDVAGNRWQNALLAMLREVHDLPLTGTTEADLHKRSSSILDFFFGLYVRDVEELVHQGLVKRYRRTRGNQLALKGRLDFPRHIQQNIVHQERFFVEHQVYDSDHLLHSLLKRALLLVTDLGRDTDVTTRAKGLDWAFENVADRALTPQTLDRIILDRKTAPYARAVQLAKMVVLNHAPDVKGGNMPLIGLMFDMNVLYERVVLKLLQRAARGTDLKVSGQDSRSFWKQQRIRPDIVIRRGDDVHLIIDTKWKLPKDGRPADADLKQMYAYNLQFGTSSSMLLYPGEPGRSIPHSAFAPGATMHMAHGCSLRYIRLFDERGNLRSDDLRHLLTELVPRREATEAAR